MHVYVTSGVELSDVLVNCSSSFVWSADSKQVCVCVRVCGFVCVDMIILNQH